MTTTLKILWVEDDYDKLSAALLQLKKSGGEVVSCTNYRDGVCKIESAEEFDCFIIDLILPSVGSDVEEDTESADADRYLGLRLIRRIRDVHGLMKPIVAFSVVRDPEVERLLDELQVDIRFSKGGNTTNRMLCDSIREAVAAMGKRSLPNVDR